LSEYLCKTMGADSTELWVSPISIWEVLILAEKGKIVLDSSPVDWVKRSLETLQINETVLNGEIAILSRQLQLPHQDPADRFIAATAIYLNLPLATVDKNLVNATWLPTIS